MSFDEQNRKQQVLLYCRSFTGICGVAVAPEFNACVGQMCIKYLSLSARTLYPCWLGQSPLP